MGAAQQFEEWQIVDKRAVARTDEGWLMWFLLSDDSDKGSSWHPYLVAEDQFTVIKSPTWAPLPGAQYAALSSPVFELLMDGNRGSGKSELLLIDYAREIDKGYGSAWRGILFRKQLGDLDEMVRKAETLFAQLYGSRFRFLHSKSDYRCVWDTGEELLFRHLANVEEYSEYHGHQYPWIGFEELTQWEDDKPYRKMFSCCRPTAQGVPTRIRANTNPSGCVPYGDVLTADRGWVDIRTIAPGDKVISVNVSGEQVVAVVSAVTHAPYKGPMKVRHGRGLDMEFTPGHRFPLFSTDRSFFTVTGYGQLPKQAAIKRTAVSGAGLSFTSFAVPLQKTRKRKNPPVLKLSGRDYAELMGWYLSEGCTVGRDRAFQIAQSKPQHRATIKALLDRCGFKQVWSKQGATVYSADWFEYLKQFGKCRDKFVPREILESGEDTLRAFFDAAVNGDGHWASEDSGQYYTTSVKLADDIAEIAVKLGYAVDVSNRQRADRDGLSYCVNFSLSRSSIMLDKDRVDERFFVGEVYCLTVPETETFFVRQDGCVWLSGNTGHNWVKKRFKLPSGHGRIIRPPGEEPRVAIKLDLRENFVLLHTDPGYINRIRAAASSPAEAKAWADGDWDVTFGGMFDDLWESKVHVVPDIKPMMIPRGWSISRSYDHGQAKPFACLWWAESNGEPMRLPNGQALGRVRGDIILFKEWYGTNGQEDTGLRMVVTKIAQGILDRETDWGIRWRTNPGPADTEIWTNDSRGTQRAPIDDFEDVLGGDCWEKADKSSGTRVRGFQKIREYLEGAKPGPDGTRERPGLFVCAGCEHWLELCPTVPRDTIKQDEIPKNYEDHLLDASRYRAIWSPSFMGQGHF